MRKSRFDDGRIMATPEQAESAMPIAELCREHGMGGASFYKWRAKHGGMDASLMTEAVSAENQRLRRMFADLSLRNVLPEEALGKKPRGHPAAARWPRQP